MITKLAYGERARVRQIDDDEWCEGRVIMASTNIKPQQSIGIALESAVRAGDGIIAGVLPLSVNYEDETVQGLTGDMYEIDRSA